LRILVCHGLDIMMLSLTMTLMPTLMRPWPWFDSHLTRLQAWLRANGGPMTLLKGFAAGTPGFGPVEGKYGALAVAGALKLSAAPAERTQAVALLDAARQVRVWMRCSASWSYSNDLGWILLVLLVQASGAYCEWHYQGLLSFCVTALLCILPRQASAILSLLQMPPGDDADTMRLAFKRGSIKVRTIVISASDPGYTACCRVCRV